MNRYDNQALIVTLVKRYDDEILIVNLDKLLQWPSLDDGP